MGRSIGTDPLVTPRPAMYRLAIPALLLATACADEPTPPSPGPPDVLLVTIDTLRADHTSLHGYERRTTPVLESLAAEGVWLSNAYAPTSTTAPSVASLMTSVYPRTHGVTSNGRLLPRQLPTLAENLRSHGYTTAAFVSSIVVSSPVGFDRGFDHYDDDFSEADSTLQLKEWHGLDVEGGMTDRRADDTTDRAIRWLAGRPLAAGPTFVWVHYMDPHEPYVPPLAFGDPFAAAAHPRESLQRAIARYDTEIAFVDQQLGRLLDSFDARARANGSLVAVTADHGEAFLDHGWRGHGAQLYEESVRTPLVFRYRHVLEARGEIRHPAGLVDVALTLLGLLDAEPDPTVIVEGNDLTPVLLGDLPADPERPIFFQRQSYARDGRLAPLALYDPGRVTFGAGLAIAGAKHGIRIGRWKYLEAPAERTARELYDLGADPRERLNLISADPETAARLAARLAAHRADPAATAPALDAHQAALEALGYVEPAADP